MRHQYLFLLFTLSVLLASTQSTVAGSASGTLTVGATVVKTCILTTIKPLALGSYDPVDTYATSDLRTRGNITVICSKGSTPSIAIGVSSNAPGIGTTRATLSKGNKLSYEIYKDAGLTRVRTQPVEDILSIGVVSLFQTQIIPAHRCIPAGHNVPVGTFADTVIVTVNF
jgi:spore coat protein U-like protein